MPHIREPAWLAVPAVGLGIGWASIMGNPYVILADAIPPERTGVYMGIFNMMIVMPMLLMSVTLPFYYDRWLGGDPRHVLILCGVLLLLAAAAMLTLRDRTGRNDPATRCRAQGVRGDQVPE